MFGRQDNAKADSESNAMQLVASFFVLAVIVIGVLLWLLPIIGEIHCPDLWEDVPHGLIPGLTDEQRTSLVVADEQYAGGVYSVAWLYREREDGTYAGRGFILREAERSCFHYEGEEISRTWESVPSSPDPHE